MAVTNSTIVDREAAIAARQREIAGAQKAQAGAREKLAKARKDLDKVALTLVPYREAVAAAERAVLDAEAAEERACAIGNSTIRATLTRAERAVLENWHADLRDELATACTSSDYAKYRDRTPVISALLGAVPELELHPNPVAEVARLREMHQVPEIERRPRVAVDSAVLEAARLIVATAGA